MNIETRFDIGQKVVRVARLQRRAHERCPSCGGKGKLTVERLDGTSQESSCGNCRGRGVVQEVWYDLYEIVGTARIGQIEVKLRVNASWVGDTREERYMTEDTGIGSGSVHALTGEPGKQVWSHSHLFATRDEAEAFCEAENAPILAEVEEKRARLREGLCDEVPA